MSRRGQSHRSRQSPPKSTDSSPVPMSRAAMRNYRSLATTGLMGSVAVLIFSLGLSPLFPTLSHAVTFTVDSNAPSSWLLDEVREVHKRQAGLQPWSAGVGEGGGFCPPSCAPCDMKSCQLFQMRCIPSMVNCCCRSQMFDLKTACDGEEAVAGCMNNLCGAGFYCSRGQFCCRCANGKSLGLCVNGLCPAGYACNENNYCCAVGPGSVIGRCVNGKCPPGYTCGAGDLCYSTSIITSPTGWPPPGVGNGLSGNSIVPNPFANFYATTTPFPYVRRMRPAVGNSARSTRVGKKSATERAMKGAKKRGRGKKGPLEIGAESGRIDVKNAHGRPRGAGARRHNFDAETPVLYDDYQGEQMLSGEEMRLIAGVGQE